MLLKPMKRAYTQKESEPFSLCFKLHLHGFLLIQKQMKEIDNFFDFS